MGAIPALLETEAARAVYRRLVQELRTLGPVKVEEKKTSLHLVAGDRAFVGVHPRKSGLVLQIVTTTPLKGGRIRKVEQVSAHRFHNTVKLETEAEVDRELIGWLRTAYDLSDA
jgi:hypothetical protein